MGSRFWFLAMAISIIVVVFVQAAASEGEMNMVLYMHDKLKGKNVTAIPVAGLNGTSSDAGTFGTVVAISDVMTKRPPHLSEYHAESDNIVGRVQGTYVQTHLVTGLDFFLAFSIIFQNMEYNGSTLEIHGTDRFTLPQREYAVVGGTGKFRFARGYVIGTTESVYGENGENSVTKYNITFRTN